MTEEERIKSLFYRIRQELKGFDNTRQTFYITRECLRLFEQCPKKLSGKESPFSEIFHTAFYYFLKTSQLEEASKVFISGFRDMSPQQLIKLYSSIFKSPKNPDDAYAFRFYLDQVLSLLAKIGYEHEVLEMPGVPPSKELKAESWPILLNRFMTGTSMLQFFELLYDLININRSYPEEKIRSIGINTKINTKKVKFRRWLLKRQMLGIYSAIMLDLRKPGVLYKPTYADTLNSFKRLAADAFENYLSLICDSAKEYIDAAVSSLKTVQSKMKPLWHDEVVENLIHQFNHIKKRCSDVGDFFKETMDINLFGWNPEELKKYLNISEKLFKNKTVEVLINELEKKRQLLVDSSPTEILRCKEKKHPGENIQQSIADALCPSADFWDVCREKFTPARLKLLAVSLDNQYSTEAAYFFKTPAIKLDKKEPIETELCLLRKWGSTGGLFESERDINACFGGGYFIFHNGFGLAIDVGPDFLRNLTQYTDFDLMDINGVVCTHTHHDHAAEFKRIVMGIREYNRTVGYKRLYYLFPDADDLEMVHPEKIREDFCIDVFHGKPRETTNEGENVYYFPNNQWGKKHGIRIQPIRVKHEIYKDRRYYQLKKSIDELKEKLKEPGISQEKSKAIQLNLNKIQDKMKKIQNEYKKKCGKGKKLGTEGERGWSYGLLVSPLIEEKTEKNGKEESVVKPLTTILFSGDTEYEKNLFEKIDPGFKPELIVLNISSVRIGDVIAAKSGEEFKTPLLDTKNNHLGYTGALTLLTRLRDQYKVAVVSEFFEPQSEVDSRLLITGSLMKDLNTSKNAPKKILASEPGIRFRWPKRDRLEIFCTHLCHVDNKGFVTPYEKNIRQAKRSSYARKEPILMVCNACEKDKRNVYKID